jgi:hypothetical protein
VWRDYRAVCRFLPSFPPAGDRLWLDVSDGQSALHSSQGRRRQFTEKQLFHPVEQRTPLTSIS